MHWKASHRLLRKQNKKKISRWNLIRQATTTTCLMTTKNRNRLRQGLFNRSSMEARTILDTIKVEQKKANKKTGRKLEWLIIVALVLAHAVMAMSQTGGLNDLNYQATSEFVPTIKDAIKLSE